MKLMNLMMAFDYAEAGNKMLWEFLGSSDNQVSSVVQTILNRIFQNINNKQSVSTELEALRNMVCFRSAVFVTGCLASLI